MSEVLRSSLVTLGWPLGASGRSQQGSEAARADGVGGSSICQFIQMLDPTHNAFIRCLGVSPIIKTLYNICR